MSQKKIVFIVGPTAVGKTEVGLSLAKVVGGEIVSCDAMQVYRELSIITAKPSPETMQEVPHHIVDIISVTDEFNVGQYNDLASQAIGRIHQKGKIPLVVGGSGLYMQVLLDGIFKEGQKDLILRKELEGRAKIEGNVALYEELRRVDPKAASKIHVNDLRRILRALEIYHSLKKPLSELQADRHGLWDSYDIRIFGMQRDRNELYERINARIEAMFERGALEEVQEVRRLKLSKSAQAVIGIKEINGYLKDECDLSHAKEEMKQNTRRFAKRQLTWFRKEKRLRWIDIKKEDGPERITQRILAYLS